MVIAVVRFCKAEVSGTERPCPAGISEKVCLALSYFLSCIACVTSSAVCLLRWQFPVFSPFFCLGLFVFYFSKKAEIRKCLYLPSALSNSAASFDVGSCRD